MDHTRLILFALLATMGLAGCSRTPAPTTQPTTDDTSNSRSGLQYAKSAREIMGTFAEVTAVAPERKVAQAAVDAAYARLADVNRLMSDYLADSEIGRLNAAPANEPVAVAPETFACLRRALEVAEQSGGAFDVTCRPIVQLWKQAARDRRLPTAAELADVRSRVGWQKLRLDDERRTAMKAVAGLQADLGGIAKGYALDLAAEALLAAGGTSGLVNVGGDVLAVGSQASGAPWRIGIRHPFQEGLFGKLAIRDRAVATSGLQQRFFEIEGRRYSHIVDPRTGWPAEQAPSVTVIARDGMTADAWATALSVVSVAEGQARLAAHPEWDVDVLWISGTAEAAEVAQTPGFSGNLDE